MIPTAATTDRYTPADELFPLEIEEMMLPTDDLGDWWLDLGHVALPGLAVR